MYGKLNFSVDLLFIDLCPSQEFFIHMEIILSALYYLCLDINILLSISTVNKIYNSYIVLTTMSSQLAVDGVLFPI